ncbi:hypothetical protein D3C77_411540 [compost metagenome]
MPVGYFAHDIQLVTRELAQGHRGMSGDEHLQRLLWILGAHGIQKPHQAVRLKAILDLIYQGNSCSIGGHTLKACNQ